MSAPVKAPAPQQLHTASVHIDALPRYLEQRPGAIVQANPITPWFVFVTDAGEPVQGPERRAEPRPVAGLLTGAAKFTHTTWRA